jgi:type IX secretion system PorP/SprF family membrane protein
MADCIRGCFNFLFTKTIEDRNGVTMLGPQKIICMALVLIACSTSEGQSRKYASSFSTLQQYHNPAFTGFQGSVFKSYYRNQWAGFDGAPKTIFISAEINLADRLRKEDFPLKEKEQIVKTGIQHSVGLSVLHDSFGPFIENQIFANYRSSVNLTPKVKLQAGATLAYYAQSLDGSKLTSDEANDPSLFRYINQNSRASRLDFNIGLALCGNNFYVGYAMQNIKGDLGSTKDNFFNSNNKMHYVIQGGYRNAFSDHVGIIFNGLFRFDDLLKETLEGQVKGVFYNTAWLGFGYRKSLAYSLHTGFRVKQLRLSYAYEIPVGKAQMTGSGTNEIVLTYELQKITYNKVTRKMSIW